jgi:AraC-like DNA-binding protein
MYKLHINSEKNTVLFPLENEIQPAVVYFVYRKCTQKWRMLRQFVNNFDITYVVEGRASYTINNKSYEIQAGDLICLTEADVREAVTYPKDLMHCFSVNFKFSMKSDFPRLPFPQVSHIGLRGDIIEYFNEFFYTWSEKTPGYKVQASGLLLLIIHAIYKQTVLNTFDSTIGDFRIRQIIQYIIKHYREKITFKSLAAMVGLNTTYLGMLFKRNMGMSLRQYLLETRIKQSINMLKSGEHTVTDVAGYMGFTDIFYFYRQFKKIMGVAPSHFLPKKEGDNNSLYLKHTPPPHTQAHSKIRAKDRFSCSIRRLIRKNSGYIALKL